MSETLNNCLVSVLGDVPAWLTKGKTVLIMKDETKRNEITNYRPIYLETVYFHHFRRNLPSS